MDIKNGHKKWTSKNELFFAPLQWQKFGHPSFEMISKIYPIDLGSTVHVFLEEAKATIQALTEEDWL